MPTQQYNYCPCVDEVPERRGHCDSYGAVEKVGGLCLELNKLIRIDARDLGNVMVTHPVRQKLELTSHTVTSQVKYHPVWVRLGNIAYMSPVKSTATLQCLTTVSTTAPYESQTAEPLPTARRQTNCVWQAAASVQRWAVTTATYLDTGIGVAMTAKVTFDQDGTIHRIVFQNILGNIIGTVGSIPVVTTLKLDIITIEVCNLPNLVNILNTL